MSLSRARGDEQQVWGDDARDMLEGQTQILELIAAAAPLPDVLNTILILLEDLIAGARCSVLLLDRDHGTLHHGAAPSLPDAYIASIDGMSIGEQAGSCGTAALLNVAVVAVDVRTDSRWDDFRDAAVSAGLRSCWSTPIDGRDGLPLGTFAVYHEQPHRPTRREQLLVGRFTHLAAVAIDHVRLLEDRQARLEAETARRTAEAASHAKSELLAAVGHEARTPIQAIVGFAELLGTIDLDEARRREALAHIDAAAGHVMDLLTDVLDLSRIEAGALPLALEPVGVREVADEVLGLLSATAQRRQVQLSHDLVDDVVCADRRRLRQVLLNLLSNAIRHGKAGGRVEVRNRSTPQDATVVLSVDDDGPGIPLEILPRLFTPFARAPSSPAGKAASGPGEAGPYESVGLGLGLAHGLMAAMGGDLTVGSSLPTGTSMLLRLPRAVVPPTP